MWQEIFLGNRAPLAAALGGFRRALDDLERLIEAGDAAAVETALARIKAAREGLA
jgi:prephenate dehydrogenase